MVATAGLETGQITRNSTINCTRVYRYYLNQGSSFAPTCLGYHGAINVIGALEVSCNIFFYELGRRLGIDTIDQYATYLGLGTYESASGSDNPNGLELSNGRSSTLTSPENTEAAGGTWYEGNVVQAAIGQMDTYVTPLQMCLQASTIANHGTRYASHLVKSIETYDGTVLEETQPEVISEFDMQDSTYEAVRDGMIAAATRTNIGLSSSELGYSVAVKTGTPQVDSGGVRTNNCAIAFTEGGPNISIAVMLEDGTLSSQMGYMAPDQAAMLYTMIYETVFGNDAIEIGQSGSKTVYTMSFDLESMMKGMQEGGMMTEEELNAALSELDGMVMDFVMKVTIAGEDIGCTLDMNMEYEGFKMVLDMTADNLTSEGKFELSVEGTGEFALDFETKLTETDDEPAMVPTDGDIVDLEQLFSDMLGTYMTVW